MVAVVVALIAGLACLHVAAGCGMVTHNLIAQRARQWFQDEEDPGAASTMIANHLASLQGGAPFPVRPARTLPCQT